MTTTLSGDLGEISSLQAMQWLFGITPSDLKVTANDDTAPAAIDRSRVDSLFTALVDRLQSAGYEVGTADARKVEVPINRNRAKEGHPIVDLVSYMLRKDGRSVGYAHHAWGPEGGLVLAKARRWDGSLEVFADQKGKIERVVFDHKGLAVSSTIDLQPIAAPAAVSCQSVCGVICGQGGLATIGECLAACAETGPGEVFCAPLCAILVGVGCLFDCDTICGLCC